jgi:hypothetical protein
MKRALTLLSLCLFAACASKDGFIDNDVSNCGPGSEIGIRAGWDTQGSTNEMGRNRLTMLVEVANNSDEEITVKRIYVEPAVMQDDSPYEFERGAADPMKVIAEGDASTFDIAMAATRRYVDGRNRISTSSGAEMTVTVLLEPEQTYRCRFRVPMGF